MNEHFKGFAIMVGAVIVGIVIVGLVSSYISAGSTATG